MVLSPLARQAASRALRASLGKAYASGEIALLRAKEEGRAALPSGLLGLDAALGGGYQPGSLVEVFGPPGIGKSSLAMAAAAEAQLQGLEVAVVDSERVWTGRQLVMMGVDGARLLFVDAQDGESSGAMLERLLASRRLGLVIVDSAAALLPRSESEAAIGTADHRAHARMLTQLIRRLRAIQGGAVLLAVNQTRNGEFEERSGLSMTVTAGGPDLRNSADQRIELFDRGALLHEKRRVGQRVGIKILKNVFGPPFQTATAEFLYSRGYRREAEALLQGLRQGCLVEDKRGIFYPATGVSLGADRRAAGRCLLSDPDLLSALVNDVRVRQHLKSFEKTSSGPFSV